MKYKPSSTNLLRISSVINLLERSVTRSSLLLTLLLLLVFPASSLAADTPVQVVKKFNQAVNSNKPACLYTYSGFRFQVAYSSSLWLAGPFDSQGKPVDWLDETSWTEENQVYLCSLFITTYQGYVEDSGMPAWTKTVLGKMKLVAISGSVAHVRGKVSQRFKDKKDNYAFTSDVFLVKEQGQWRIANAGNLLDRDKKTPKSLKGWKKYKAWLDKGYKITRAQLTKQIKVRKQSESKLGQSAEECSGAQRGGKDASNDVFFSSGGDLIPDQQVASVDITNTRLLTKSGEMVLCFKFRSAPSSPYSVSLDAFTDDKSRSSLGVLGVSVVDGKAYSLLSVSQAGESVPAEAAKAQVSQQGASVSVRLSATSTTKILGKNKFIWEASTWETDPRLDPNSKETYYDDNAHWMDYSSTQDQEGGTDDYFHHPAP